MKKAFVQKYLPYAAMTLFALALVWLMVYLYQNTSYVVEAKHCQVLSKEYRAAYYSTETYPVYIPVTKTTTNYDGTTTTYTDWEFSHMEEYQLYHPARYLLLIWDGGYFSYEADNQHLYNILAVHQRLWMMVEYRCWKGEKQTIVAVELIENIS